MTQNPKTRRRGKKTKNRSSFLDNSTPKDRAGIRGISPVVRLWEILYFISPHQQPPCLSFPLLFLQLDELLMTPATSRKKKKKKEAQERSSSSFLCPQGRKKRTVCHHHHSFSSCGGCRFRSGVCSSSFPKKRDLAPKIGC